MKRPVRTTVADAIAATARKLSRAKVGLGHGTATYIDEAAFLVGEAIGVAPEALGAKLRTLVSDPHRTVIERWVAARIKTRKPAPYITQSAYLQGLRFYVDDRVIVPRSFISELLFAEHIVGGAGFISAPGKVKRVLDLCTGSACLAILAAKVFTSATVDAVELSVDAFEVATKNVAMHRQKKRVQLFQGDLFAPLPRASYDLIITNPPYVAPAAMRKLPAEYRREPELSLAGGGRDGLDVVARILATAPQWLSPDGALLCEVGSGRKALEARYPELPFLWLDTAESSGEVFWITAGDLRTSIVMQ